MAARYGRARRVLVNSTGYVTLQLVARALGVVTAILVARTLGPRDFGVFAYVASIVAVAATGADLGLDMALIREVAKSETRPVELVQAGLFLRCATALACAGIGILVALAMAPRRYAILLILQIVSLPLSAPFRCLAAYYTGSEKIIAGSSMAVVQAGLNLGGVLAVRALAGGIAGISLVFSLSFAVVSVAGVVQLKRHLGVGLLRLPEFPYLRRVFRGALEFTALTVASSVHYKVAPLLLGLLAGSQAVGLFSAASRLTDSMMFLPAAIMGAILPTLSRSQPHTWEYREAVERTAKYLAVLCLPVAAAVTEMSPHVIRWLYGTQWTGSAAPLAIMAWGWAIICCTCALPTGLNASRNTPLVIRTVATAIGANVITGLLLDKFIGPSGSALAVLAAEATAAGCYLKFSQAKLGPVRLARELWRPALCTAIMLAIMYGLGYAAVPWAAQLAAGVAGYAFSCVVLKPFDRLDAELMRGFKLDWLVAWFATGSVDASGD